MVRILPIKETAGRKKALLAQSDIHRRTLQLEVAMLQHSVQQSAAHFKKRFALVGLSSLAVSLGASVARRLISKKGPGEKPGVVSRILSGVSFFSQIKGLFNRVTAPSDDHS